MNPGISSDSSHYQPSLNQLGERLFYAFSLPADLLVQQPPFNDPFKCVLRLWIGMQVSEYLIIRIRFIRRLPARVHTHSFAPR